MQSFELVVIWPILVSTIMVDIDNIQVLQGTCFNICCDPLWSCNCAVIVVHHQDKNKHLWKLPYSRQLKYNKAENVVALPSNQDLVNGLLVIFFLILKVPSHTFLPPPFHHLILEPSSLEFLLSHIPKYRILLTYVSLLSSVDPIQSYKYHFFSIHIFQFAIGFTVVPLSTAFSYTKLWVL